MHRLRLKHRRQSSDGYGPRRRGSFAGVLVEEHDVQKKMRDGWQQGRDRMDAADIAAMMNAPLGTLPAALCLESLSFLLIPAH